MLVEYLEKPPQNDSPPVTESHNDDDHDSPEAFPESPDNVSQEPSDQHNPPDLGSGSDPAFVDPDPDRHDPFEETPESHVLAADPEQKVEQKPVEEKAIDNSQKVPSTDLKDNISESIRQ